MNTDKFIKVTDKKGKSTVILAGNRAFYLAQGCEITEPTEEEVAVAFPEYAKKVESVAKPATSTRRKSKITADETTED